MFGGAAKGRQAGSGSPSRAGGAGTCLWKTPALLFGTEVSAFRTFLEVLSKGTRPDVSFRGPLPHVLDGLGGGQLLLLGCHLPQGPCPEPSPPRG